MNFDTFLLQHLIKKNNSHIISANGRIVWFWVFFFPGLTLYQCEFIRLCGLLKDFMKYQNHKALSQSSLKVF
jgi:hypothetical protein